MNWPLGGYLFSSHLSASFRINLNSKMFAKCRLLACYSLDVAEEFGLTRGSLKSRDYF